MEFGRLAFRLVDGVHLVPMNYVVDGRTLLFRTTSGNKLLSAALYSNVAFEIDWYDDGSAWSVVARGRARRLPDREAHRLDHVSSRSWVPTNKNEVIELEPRSSVDDASSCSAPERAVRPRESPLTRPSRLPHLGSRRCGSRVTPPTRPRSTT